MDAKHRGIQILGWVSALVGYGLALVLIRGIFLGITRGFGTVPVKAFWVALGYLIFFGLAAYLVIVGRRAISIARGNSPSKSRFGWGRILLGAIFLYGNMATRFHLIPENGSAHFRHLEPANPTEAVSMKITGIAILLGCLSLIFSGILRGFKVLHVTAAPSN
jgi:hypothetical protein